MLGKKSQETLIPLVEVLTQVKQLATNDFSGIGVVVYKDIQDIPIFPLRAQNFDVNPNELVSDLLQISSYGCEFHDGFHFISESFKISHVSQYFSPPIISHAEVDYSQKLGGRFMAALFGSYIQGVLLTGILTKNSGIKIFESGKIIYSKHWNEI